MEKIDYVATILLVIISTACYIAAFLQYKEIGPLMNNAYLYASKAERMSMDKTPYYRQSAVVFFSLGIIFTLNTIDSLLRTTWMIYLEIPMAIAVLVYAVVSTIRIEKKKQK